MTSQPLIHELKAVIAEEYHLEKSNEETTVIAEQLIGYFETLVQIAIRLQANDRLRIETKGG